MSDSFLSRHSALFRRGRVVARYLSFSVSFLCEIGAGGGRGRRVSWEMSAVSDGDSAKREKEGEEGFHLSPGKWV